MKKNLENLLFDLLENGQIKLTNFGKTDEAYLEINSSVDPVRAQIFQAIDAPDKIRVHIVLPTQTGGIVDEIIIPSKNIENFLSFAYHTMERQEYSSAKIIREYGQAKFNELREDILNILAEKPSKNFMLIEDYKLDRAGDFIYTIEDKKTGANSIITIKQKQEFNNILPLKVHLQTLIKSGEYLKSAGMEFFVAENELYKYPLIFNEKPKIKTEEEFLNDIISANSNNGVIKSKVLEHFNLSVLLPEKEMTEKKPKI